MMKEINIFFQISVELTGFDNLPSNLVEVYYYKMIAKSGYSETLRDITKDLSSETETVKELIKKNISYEMLAKGIIFLWYTSELINWDTLKETETSKLLKTACTQGEYYEGLIWKAISAHPLGLSGGYFGHWKYEPEN